MPDLKLYYFPGTCARVAMIGLEEAGLDYSTEVVRFFRGEHKQPAYLSINPKGKVPTLAVDGRPLSENLAIAQYLSRIAPQADLMPTSEDAFADGLAWADLAWCAATLHPIVTRIRMPHLFAGPEHASTVWVEGDKALAPNFTLIEQRLAEGPWILGEAWSLVDAFVFWLWDTAIGADVDPSPFERIARHAGQMRLRPAVQRALAIEGAAFEQFEAEGTPFGMPPSARPRVAG